MRPLFNFKKSSRLPPTPPPEPTCDTNQEFETTSLSSDDDYFRLLQNHENLICISDRVDQQLIFPFIPEPSLLDGIVDTILKGTSVLVVGEPGIGKRTMSLGVARRLHEMRQSGLTDTITSRSVYTLSLGREFWSETEGVSMSSIQNRIRQVFQLVQRAGPEKIVFCIDDLDVLSFIDRLVLKERPLSERDDTEPLFSIENMLRFLLFTRKVLCLCTCIKAPYDRLVQRDTYYDEKFSKSFKVFHMDQPPPQRSAQIVSAHKQRIEAELDVVIEQSALHAAVAYSVKFLTHRSLPEKALELLQEACEATVSEAEDEEADHLQSGGRIVISESHVGRLVQKWCRVTDSELEQALSNTNDFN